MGLRKTDPAAIGADSEQGYNEQQEHKGLTVRAFLKELQGERAAALATRDPIAIRHAHARWSVANEILKDTDLDSYVNLASMSVGVKLAADALDCTPQQVRRLIRERKLSAYKENDQWRIPLNTLL